MILAGLVLSLAPASWSLSITLSGPTVTDITSGVATEDVTDITQITFSVGLDAPTDINGYDLTLAWDPFELRLSSATPIWGFGFTRPPSELEYAGTRVAAILTSVMNASTLFSVTFDVLQAAAFFDDGLPDVEIYVDPIVNGEGISPGSLSISNPTGAGIDVVDFSPPTTSTVPVLPPWGGLVLAGLLLGAGAWRTQRR